MLDAVKFVMLTYYEFKIYIRLFESAIELMIVAFVKDTKLDPTMLMALLVRKVQSVKVISTTILIIGKIFLT